MGLVLDSSVLIAAARRKLTAAQAIESVLNDVGEMPLALSAITVAEIGHGIYRSTTGEIHQRRRRFLDDLKATIPIYSFTAETAELVARIGGEQASAGITIPLSDLIIGACALELGYAVGTGNTRDFDRIPGLRVVLL